MANLKSIARMVRNNSNRNDADQFLNEFIRTIEINKPQYKPSKTYKPSSMGGCMREIYYQVTGAELDGTPDNYINIGIGESGTTRHELLQNYVMKMKESGFDWEWVDVEEYLKDNPVESTRVVEKKGNETRCYSDEWDLSFMCDGIIKHNNTYYILEIKTESTYKFDNHDEPFPKHKIQASCYSLALGINKVIFLYENRDLLTKKAYLVEVTEEMLNHVADIINECDEFVDSNVVPPKSENPKNCQYCKYKRQCRRDGDGS